MESTTERWFEIDPETLAELRDEYALIEQHRKTARFLERDMESVLEKKYGIDLGEEWELDIDTGRLIRKSET